MKRDPKKTTWVDMGKFISSPLLQHFVITFRQIYFILNICLLAINSCQIHLGRKYSWVGHMFKGWYADYSIWTDVLWFLLKKTSFEETNEEPANDKRMYYTGTPSCPVQSFKLLMSKTDPNDLSLFNECDKGARHKVNPMNHDFWYSNKPVKLKNASTLQTWWNRKVYSPFFKNYCNHRSERCRAYRPKQHVHVWSQMRGIT